MLNTGTRLQSQVCDTQVIVVRSGPSLADLRAGGVAMVPLDGPLSSGAHMHPAFAAGNLVGKRYVDDSGAEVLVTRQGAGTLSIGYTPMLMKETKPLPASD